jgi:hypothetical protein
MAQDMPAPVGHPVYAVGDGTVLESNPNAGYGGVLVVLHKTGDGHYFKAVYGHIIRAAGMVKGATVKAGQVIGHVNHCAHVHFGIHPGRAYPPDGNPYRGHTYDPKKTYGWVDPVAYLRSNPRILPYAAPALPAVATVDTTSQPTVLGVADGCVYWSIFSGGTTCVFSRALAGGATNALPAGTALPSLDTTRYEVETTTDAFTLSDPLPVITLTCSSTSPAWKHSTTVSGRIVSALGSAFTGATVVIESSIDGASWKKVATALTGPTGAYTLTWTPSRRVGLRAHFTAPSVYVPAFSAVSTVAPRPSLSAPVVPRAVTHARSFTAHGTLAPRHVAGRGAVVLRVQRRTGSGWADYATTVTTYRDSASGTTYAGSFRLPAGSWRVRAEAPSDTLHAATTSPWSAFTVR